MKIKEICKEINEQYTRFQSDFESLRSKVVAEDEERYEAFYGLLKKYSLHPRLLDLLADQMLIEPDEKFHGQYGLEEIETIRQINLAINPSDAVVLASYLHLQDVNGEPGTPDIRLIDDLINELQELKSYLTGSQF